MSGVRSRKLDVDDLMAQAPRERDDTQMGSVIYGGRDITDAEAQLIAEVAHNAADACYGAYDGHRFKLWEELDPEAREKKIKRVQEASRRMDPIPGNHSDVVWSGINAWRSVVRTMSRQMRFAAPAPAFGAADMKHWLEGFCAGIDEPPTMAQWEAVKAKIASTGAG